MALAGAVGVAAAAAPPQLPAGTLLHVRLTTAISTRHAKAGDPVAAALRVAVPVAGRVVPAGAVVRGVVVEATAFEWRRPEAALRLDFREIVVGGQPPVAIRTRVTAVDNARESVDANGRVLGLAPPAEQPATDEDLVMRAALLPELFLQSAEYRIREAERPDITFDAGVDLTLEIVAATADVATVEATPLPSVAASIGSFVGGLPDRASAGSPPRPADIINVMVVGSAEAIARAFRDAGWTTAVALSVRADIRTVMAVAENRGYQLGPVSLLFLNGKPPDLVFQRQNDTFAKRHHIRIWSWPQPWDGRQVWLAAATHDVGVKFVREERTFTHSIDPHIDREREKVIDDLRFVGAVQALSLVARPSLPARTQNATLDVMETDGRIAVVALR